MQSLPRAGRLLAMIDALAELTDVAVDIHALADTVAKNLAEMDGASGAAVRFLARNRDVLAISDPALEPVNVRNLFPQIFGGPANLTSTTYVADTAASSACDAVVARTLNVRSVIAAPLVHRERRLGTLWVYSSHPGAFNAEDTELVERFTAIVAAVVELSLQFHEKLQESRTDDLTGLQNRRAYDETLRHSLAEAQRYHTPLSLIVSDLDGFKAINDCYGHVKGDAALMHVAAVMEGEVRGTDMVFRIGGDEFAIIMPHSAGEAARKLMSRISRRLRTARSDFGRVGLSYGVADAEASDDPLTLHDRADRCLYASKHARTA
jgi:diguanylate cyclase (GGDEF)-like protein